MSHEANSWFVAVTPQTLSITFVWNIAQVRVGSLWYQYGRLPPVWCNSCVFTRNVQRSGAQWRRHSVCLDGVLYQLDQFQRGRVFWLCDALRTASCHALKWQLWQHLSRDTRVRARVVVFGAQQDCLCLWMQEVLQEIVSELWELCLVCTRPKKECKYPDDFGGGNQSLQSNQSVDI